MIDNEGRYRTMSGVQIQSELFLNCSKDRRIRIICGNRAFHGGGMSFGFRRPLKGDVVSALDLSVTAIPEVTSLGNKYVGGD